MHALSMSVHHPSGDGQVPELFERQVSLLQSAAYSELPFAIAVSKLNAREGVRCAGK